MLRFFQLRTRHQGAPALRFMALLMLASLPGCTAGRSPTPLAMMGATASPAYRQDATASQPMAEEAAEATRGVDYDFVPSFTATCRPDHQFTHLDLALAFVDARPSVTFDFLPMFGSTAAPPIPTAPPGRPAPFELQVNTTADADTP